VTRTAKDRPKKAANRDTTTLYVRIPRAVLDRLRLRAAGQGWPHTIASVAAHTMAIGLSVVDDRSRERLTKLLQEHAEIDLRDARNCDVVANWILKGFTG
jgi:hypothetical protein